MEKKYKIVSVIISLFAFLYLLFLYKVFSFEHDYYDYTIWNDINCSTYRECINKSLEYHDKEDNHYKSFFYFLKAKEFSEYEINIEYKTDIYGELAHHRNDFFDIEGALYFYSKKSNTELSCWDLRAITYLFYEKKSYNKWIDFLDEQNVRVKQCALFYLKWILYLWKEDYKNSYNSFKESLVHINSYTNKLCTEYLLESFLFSLKNKIINPENDIFFNFLEVDNLCRRTEENDNNWPDTYKPLYRDNVFLEFIKKISN